MERYLRRTPWNRGSGCDPIAKSLDNRADLVQILATLIGVHRSFLMACADVQMCRNQI